MIVLVGLGNIGDAYANTKHNAGFWVLDELSRRWKTNFKPGKGEYFFMEKKSWNILLIKPTIGMNNSGIVVKDIMKNWNYLKKISWIQKISTKCIKCRNYHKT